MGRRPAEWVWARKWYLVTGRGGGWTGGHIRTHTRTRTHKINGSRCLFLSWQSCHLFSRLSGTADLSSGRESGCEVCLVYLLGVFRLALFSLWEVNYVTWGGAFFLQHRSSIALLRPSVDIYVYVCVYTALGFEPLEV